jgi:hypothetical protein
MNKPPHLYLFPIFIILLYYFSILDSYLFKFMKFYRSINRLKHYK